MILHPSRFHKISELVIGGCCGCCGKWVGDQILENHKWVYTICESCDSRKGGSI
jgi:hypothetical protein